MIIKIHIFVFKDYGISTYQHSYDEEQNVKIVTALVKISEANYLLEVDTSNVRIGPN